MREVYPSSRRGRRDAASEFTGAFRPPGGVCPRYADGGILVLGFTAKPPLTSESG